MLAGLQRKLRLAAEFSMFAARSDDWQTLLDETCRIAAEGVGTTFAKLLVYQQDERAFVLQAGVGWREGIVGQVRLDADTGTAAGFAWHSGQPIMSNDLVTEGRFRVPEILVAHGIVRSINVVVRGYGEAAFGILEVESPEPGEFAAYDVWFLQLLAHSLAAAIGQGARQACYDEQTARSTNDHQMSLRELQHRVRNDLQGICCVVASEARRATDPRQREGFGRVNRRVLALAVLYDHLLGEGVDDSVDVGAYLHSLCDRVADASDLSARAIELCADMQPLTMSLGRAVRLAVAVNELVANAAKHAFPDERPGRITVRLLAKGDDGTGCPVLTIADDGCGFNGPRPGSAGLSFVESLAHQAGGVLAREDGTGTRWRIKLAF